MGELIIAGESVADLLGSKFVNFLQPPYWDATFEGQLEQNGVRRPGLHPYSAEAKNKGLRATRPVRRCAAWGRPRCPRPRR
jgi:hypothetical protein